MSVTRTGRIVFVKYSNCNILDSAQIARYMRTYLFIFKRLQKGRFQKLLSIWLWLLGCGYSAVATLHSWFTDNIIFLDSWGFDFWQCVLKSAKKMSQWGDCIMVLFRLNLNNSQATVHTDRIIRLTRHFC